MQTSKEIRKSLMITFSVRTHCDLKCFADQVFQVLFQAFSFRRKPRRKFLTFWLFQDQIFKFYYQCIILICVLSRVDAVVLTIIALISCHCTVWPQSLFEGQSAKQNCCSSRERRSASQKWRVSHRPLWWLPKFSVQDLSFHQCRGLAAGGFSSHKTHSKVSWVPSQSSTFPAPGQRHNSIISFTSYFWWISVDIPSSLLMD